MKKKIVLLCMAGLLLFANPVGAVPFPEKTDEIVQDEDNYLPKEAQDNFTAFVKQFPYAYKLVVVESTQPEAQSADEYAQKLYDNYNLNENTMMIVLDINTQELGVYPGKALVDKGAKMELLHEKIVSYYEPFRNQKEYAKGIELFITETNAELSRLAENGAASAGQAVPAPVAAPQPDASGERSLWLSLPWWLYLIGFLFIGTLGLLIYSFVRRRHVFAMVDSVEDWKDQLVEKIHLIEVNKSMRRSSGSTEERYVQLANRKEHLLRVRIPDVEMIILEAEEACDRFRFQMAAGLLAEAEELLEQIEAEMSELKADMTKVVQTKKESKAVLPEIGKLFESVDRKLGNFRLEYGISFHGLKTKLDDVERMRSQVKEAQASGDDVKAYETTVHAQTILNGLSAALEQIPALVKTVQSDMPEELKEMEEGIAAVLTDGYELSQTSLEASMLQARQLLSAATSALEEGNLELVSTHVKAFHVMLDAAFQGIEETVLQQREAARKVEERAVPLPAAMEETSGEELSVEEPVAEAANVKEAWAGVAEAAPAAAPAIAVMAPASEEVDGQVEAGEEHEPIADEEFYEETREEQVLPASLVSLAEITVEERHQLWAKKQRHDDQQVSEQREIVREEVAEEESADEYELVIPKGHAAQEEKQKERPAFVIETEDDVLDELERISGVLVKVRQQIKRSYLPGIPGQLKYHFEQSVQLLGQIKATMERYQYELDEVAVLLEEVNDFVLETESLTEKVIANCQLAEGAIQYTNRYRRQNRQVNDLLQKAEQSFRQLSFQEAYEFAEEARLLVEGEQQVTDNRWILRKKKKG